MKILGIETSSHIFSLGMNEDDKVLYEIRRNRQISENRDAEFFLEAQRLLEYYGLENIKVIAIDIGPGMFTSLRVGLSLAKGLASVQNIAIVAVNALDIIGIPASIARQPVLAAINAYHGEIYAAFYEQGKRLSDYLLTTPQEIKKLIKIKTLVIGSGIEAFKTSESVDDSYLSFVNGNFFLPTASRVIDLALPRIYNSDFDTLDTLEPYYIKKTDAERKYDQSNAL